MLRFVVSKQNFVININVKTLSSYKFWLSMGRVTPANFYGMYRDMAYVPFGKPTTVLYKFVKVGK